MGEKGSDSKAVGRALVEGVDRLHAERGALVMQARDMRLKGEHAEREEVWERVTEITLQIEQSEKEIASYGGREALSADSAAVNGLRAALGVLGDVLAALAIVAVAVALKCIVDPA